MVNPIHSTLVAAAAALALMLPGTSGARNQSPDQSLKTATAGSFVGQCCNQKGVDSDGKRWCIGTDFSCCGGASRSCKDVTCEEFFPSPSQIAWCREQCDKAEKTCRGVSSSNPHPLSLVTPGYGSGLLRPSGELEIVPGRGAPSPTPKRPRPPAAVLELRTPVKPTAAPAADRLARACEERCTPRPGGGEICQMVCVDEIPQPARLKRSERPARMRLR